jgi:hypothetical protein
MRRRSASLGSVKSETFTARPEIIHSPNGLATLRSIVGNCISNDCADIFLLRNLSGPLVHVLSIILLELLSGTHVNPAAETAAICESFGYEAFIVQRGEKIAALPAITALGKNTSWGTDIEPRNVLFLPR